MNGKFILLEGSADGVFEANIKPHQVACERTLIASRIWPVLRFKLLFVMVTDSIRTLTPSMLITKPRT